MHSTAQITTEAPKLTRIEELIDQFGNLANLASDLGMRVTRVVDRTMGKRPEDGSAGSPTQVPNGSLDKLAELNRRLGLSLEYIRDELQKLETAL